MKKGAQQVIKAPSTGAFQRNGISAAFASIASNQAVSCKDPLATKQVGVNRDKQKGLFLTIRPDRLLDLSPLELIV